MKQLMIRDLQLHFQTKELDLEITDEDYNKLAEDKAIFFQTLPREFQNKYVKLAEYNCIVATSQSKRLFEFGFKESVKIKTLINMNLNIDIDELSKVEKKLTRILKNKISIDTTVINTLVDMCEVRQGKIKLQRKVKAALDNEELYEFLIKEYKQLLPKEKHEDLDDLLEKETVLNDVYNKQEYINGFKAGFWLMVNCEYLD